MKVSPYLFFEGRCEEALEFYKNALGASVEVVMRYSESPDPSHCPPGAENKVMHASFSVGETVIMASDGMASGEPTFNGVSLSIAAKDAEEAERLFAALSDGGSVRMPMGPTFFAARFGMTADRFGVSWMVVAES